MDATQKDLEIKAHWEDAAEHLYDAEGLKRTVRDHFLQEALEEAMLAYLKPGQSLLDVGCGDGASTVRFARKTQGRVVAIDYIEGFVDQTRERFQQEGLRDITVRQGDARQLSTLLADIPPVDVAISIRCLINFPTKEEQLTVARQMIDHLKPGGLYLCSEGWSESWANLDAMREACGLEKMHLVPHNLLINKADFVRHLSDKATFIDYHSLGFYIFLSRVFQPMVTAPEAPKHLHPINAAAKKLIALGIAPVEFEAIDYPGICVFRKK